MDLIDILGTEKQKIKFTELLIPKLQEYGYGTLSKNDFQDLLIYCFDKASDSKFLNKNNNYQLAKYLKTNDTNIKSMMTLTQSNKY